jgi:hypothetical protein
MQYTQEFKRPHCFLKQFRQGGGDIGKTLEISGLSRSHFYSLLKKYNLSIQSG